MNVPRVTEDDNLERVRSASRDCVALTLRRTFFLDDIVDVRERWPDVESSSRTEEDDG